MIETPVAFEHHRTVRWRDTDASGFANMAAYITWMEETEYEFLRSRNLSVVLSDDKGRIGFPRLSSELEILQPVRFEDQLLVTLQLSTCDGKKLGYDFQIHQQSNQEQVARARFTMACCRFPGNQLPYAILIPEWIEQRLLGTES
jgi:YbgC/YbaW family acyl-CoA thioester hydrolase